MPNWCNNQMTISHSNPEMMAKAIKAWNEGNFLKTLVPPPDGLDGADLYNWKVANWGTKWDIGYCGDLDNKIAEKDLDNNVPLDFCVGFDSAWSPPVNAYETLHTMGFDIEAYWCESGMCFAGEFSDGFAIDYDWNELPTVIEDIFGEVDAY